MSLNWDSLRAEHVRQACSILRSTPRKPGTKRAGLYVVFEGMELPAKQVSARAYRIANALPPDAEVRFASGEGTILRLRALGFEAGRKVKPDEGDRS